MKKVGIIGGGIAGLSCAYHLSKKGIKTVIWEKEMYVGGRMMWTFGVESAELHPRTDKLISELGLKEASYPVKLTDLVLVLPDSSIVKGEEFPKMIESLPPEEVSKWESAVEFLSGQVPFLSDVSKPWPKSLRELRDIPFSEILKKCPSQLEFLFGLVPIIRGIRDWKEMAADFGVGYNVILLQVISEKAYSFEDTMLVIPNVLAKKIIDAGNSILTNSEVKRIKKEKKGFKIYYKKEREEKTENVDELVLAVPLPVVEKIFPGLSLESDLKYPSDKCYFVNGELRPEFNRRVIFGVEGNKFNLKFLLATVPFEHRVYPVDLNKEIELKEIYKEYEILQEKEIPYSGPTISPKGKIPELKTYLEGVYLCGDFYYFPSHNTAVTTAEIVANEISKEP